MSSSRANASAKRSAMILVAFAGVVVAVIYGFLHPTTPSPNPLTQPATAPVAPPVATSSAPATPRIKSWMDLILHEHPRFPTTQPLRFPVDFAEAARLVIRSPIYLCPRGDLWITHPDAAPTAAVLRSSPSEQVHLVPDRVRYAHWSVTDAGSAFVTLVVQRTDDQLELVTVNGRRLINLPSIYDWGRAFSWNRRIVVPSDHGVGVIDPGSGRNDFLALISPGPSTEAAAQKPPIRVLVDSRGVIAWQPWVQEIDGRNQAARYIDGKWQLLNSSDNWPPRVVELIPLLDGTAIVLSMQDEPGSDRPSSRLSTIVLDPIDDAPMDQKRVEQLVFQLSAELQTDRDAATAELSRYGPRVWPILQRLRPTQPAEGQVRLDELLSPQQRPRLGVLSPVDDDLRVVTHLSDGGVILYGDSGVEVPLRGGDPRVVAPAWISVRPGRAPVLLPPALLEDPSPDRLRLSAWGDEWIVHDPITGPRRFQGNHTRPLLREGEESFTRFVGIDSRGRWLLAEDATDQPRTLVIDRFLPDPTPRLPVWNIVVEEGEVGWTEDDWPVTRRGGAWALLHDSWKPLRDDSETIRSTSTPAPSTVESDQSLLFESEDMQYFGGKAELVRVGGGVRSEWTLPAHAAGTMTPVLIRTEDRLFLFNEPGRVLRIRENPPGAAEPFEIEATFTRGIPNDANPHRIWLDPAGRIVIAHDRNKLAILFPSGRVPPEILKMMPADED